MSGQTDQRHVRARAVSPWTWRHALRDHGPKGRKSQGLLLTLYTISISMDRNGFAYPSQVLIAAGARASLPTVRRHLRFAERTGWLGIQLAGRSGKGWRHYVYRAAVPDDLQLERTELIVADDILATWGSINSQQEADNPVMSPPSIGNAPADHQAGNNCDTKVGTNHDEAGNNCDTKVGTQLVPTNSRSETPALRTHASDEAHSAQSRGERDSHEQHALRKMETRTRTVYTPEELHKRVKAYCDVGMPPDTITKACLQGASREDIRQALEECGVTWTTPTRKNHE